jgi:hypothetical protein
MVCVLILCVFSALLYATNVSCVHHLPEFRYDGMLVVPDFMVIGQQKSGTSTMAHHISRHPQIRPTRQKELLWWSSDSGDQRCFPIWEYSKIFKEGLQPEKPDLGKRMLTGEFSASYLSCTCCPSAFKTMNPNLKMVVLLREPIARLVSRFTEQRSLPGAPYGKVGSG